MNKQRLAASLLLMMLLLLPALSPAAQKPAKAAEAHRQAEQTVTIQAATQKMQEKHHARQSVLADQIEDLERELKDATRHRQKTEAFLADQKAKVAELERRLVESKKINQDLEPVLDQAFNRLNQTGPESPLELAYGRRDLAALSRMLNNYDASLSQKTGRLLEVLKDQARLGGRVVVEERDLSINERTWRVQLIRLGRLSLYALSIDGRRAWQYQAASGAFLPLEKSQAQLAKLAEIAQGRRLIDLVKVPLNRPVVSKGSGQ